MIKGRVAEVGTSSPRPKIYKQLTLPAMIPEFEHFSQLQKFDFTEQSRLGVPEVLRKRWTRSPVRGGELFQHKLNVLEDESLLLDCPEVGSNLGYRILKDMPLKYDIPLDEVQAVAAVHAHNLAVVSFLHLIFFVSNITVS